MSHPFKTACAAIALFGCQALTAQEVIDFHRDIEPILQARCLSCHGPDEVESDFRVDRKATLIGGGGSGIETIVPGNPAESYLIELVREQDEEYRMPYEEEALPEEEIVLLEKWIAQGAVLPDDFEEDAELPEVEHWSLLPVKRPEVPWAKGINNPVDAFLREKLDEKGLAFNAPADARALIRRTSILLTGLPATPERIEAFQQAHAKNADLAFESLVDELMESEPFGERWAQHWLDVIRWAETNGSEANLYRKNAWYYRDYVINAFNEDKPYDQFLLEQLAGDQLGVGEATGFLVAGPHVPTATVGREPSAIRQARADRMDEIMQTVGASLMGMTVSCARCHNHKFDPISIKDYYSLTAVFQGVEFGSRYPELDEDNPLLETQETLTRKIEKERAKLRAQNQAWEEDWTGWNEFYFPATKTKAMRLSFHTQSVGVEEIELYGDQTGETNLAFSGNGTLARTDDSMTQIRGEVFFANDGVLSTNRWRSKAPDETQAKPWIILEFEEPQSVDRLVISSNKHYYLETDYLTAYTPETNFKYTLEAQLEDGSWQAIATNTHQPEDPGLLTSIERIHDMVIQLNEQGPQPSFVGQFIEPVTSYVFHRGNPESPRLEVAPAGFDILQGDLGLETSSPDPERRIRFAEWIINPEHPLTARVMANRIWGHLFGLGIVPTPADFGTVGAPPTNQKLLDWLAAEFVNPTLSDATPWSVKGLIKTILMTDAYRQSSAPREEALAVDGSSLYLWRFPPRRVEAEVIRDGILLASGKLDPRLGGKSYRIHNEKKTYAQWEVVDNHGPDTWRRMIYQERMRRVDDRNFTAFDFPDCGQINPKRPVSTTPLQALNLMNSPLTVQQTELIAQRAVAETDGGHENATRRLFQIILGREPTQEELDASLEVAESGGLQLVSRSLINSNEFAFLP
ncbi:MAG: PSD1 and planctomycete cytochrome C domain-containing protein [Verrucomicrobia bacterium]|nr:PSD1 and planctomycete cytochrome C domain-containing protein [Verrucomicrobiota bacterium]MDA1069416.1 PSD1 and planctomycete cytochrome C domain-containing protein [Verrucomicrobiota bacterium]